MRTTTMTELSSLVGQHLGWSPWHEVTQERVNLFADATGDHQWIHVDPERAKAGPFGAPVAHGYLTLSLGTALLPEVITVADARLWVNYGCNRVRFPAPVRVGDRLRLGVELASCDEVAGGSQVALDLTFEIEGGTAPGGTAPGGTAPAKPAATAKPACVAQALFRLYA
jgi:acyl dehydratase